MDFDAPIFTWGKYSPLCARYTLSLSTISNTILLHASGPESTILNAFFQNKSGVRPRAQLSSSSPAPGMYRQLNSACTDCFINPSRPEAEINITGVKSHDWYGGTSLSHIRVFWEIHKGRRGFFRQRTREDISAPQDSNCSIQWGKRDSMAAFSVCGTHKGRCSEVSQ